MVAAFVAFFKRAEICELTMTKIKNFETAFDDQVENDTAVSVEDLAEMGGRKLVYVRAVYASDIMDDLLDENGELEFDIEDSDVLYSVHSGDGERLALVGDRDIAFAAARQHEMNPVSVH